MVNGEALLRLQLLPPTIQIAGFAVLPLPALLGMAGVWRTLISAKAYAAVGGLQAYTLHAAQSRKNERLTALENLYIDQKKISRVFKF